MSEANDVNQLRLVPQEHEWQKWTNGYEPSDDEVLAMDEEEFHLYNEWFRRRSLRSTWTPRFDEVARGIAEFNPFFTRLACWKPDDHRVMIEWLTRQGNLFSFFFDRGYSRPDRDIESDDPIVIESKKELDILTSRINLALYAGFRPRDIVDDYVYPLCLIRDRAEPDKLAVLKSVRERRQGSDTAHG